MKSKALLWALVLMLCMVFPAGCTRGDVEMQGVDTGKARQGTVETEDLYKEDDLFMEEVEEDATRMKNKAEQGIDHAQENIEQGMEQMGEALSEDGINTEGDVTTQSSMTGQEM